MILRTYFKYCFSFFSVPVITEEQAREALLEYVADHCCYGSGVAKELAFRDLQTSSAFHVRLSLKLFILYKVICIIKFACN